MDAVDLLLIAYRLSLLSFYIGVLIYTLPVPLAGVKRWAPTLISDSIIAAGLSFLFFYMFRLGEYIMGLLGGSWDFLFKWYHDSLATIISVKTLLVILQALPDPLGIVDAIRSLVSPVDKAVTGALLFLATMGGLIELVRNYAVILAAIGVALYAVPFRIARGGGAWLIAFSLVFSVGLPLLPPFLVSIAESPGSPVNVPEELSRGIAAAEIKLVDAFGAEVRAGFARVYALPDNSLVAVYRVGEDGRLYTSYGDPRVTLPSRADTSIVLETAGVSFPLEPSVVSLENYDYYSGVYHVTLEAPHVLYSDTRFIVLYSNGDPIKVEVIDVEEGTVVNGSVYLGESDYVAASFPSNCNVTLRGQGLSSSSSTTIWGDLEFRHITGYAGEPGSYNFSLVIGDCRLEETPNIKVKDYYTPSLDVSFIDYNVLASFILYYFTVPLMYLFLLFSVTAGVARLLGGRDRIQVRVV